MPEANSDLIAEIARVGGFIAFLLGVAALFAALRFGSIFREEIRKIDQLVAEYVRCRDYLLGTRRPSAESGWRTAEGEAFREAWRNFNVQIESIRDRYLKRMRPFRALLVAIVFLVLVDAAAWLLSARDVVDSPVGFLTGLGIALTWLLPPAMAWIVARLHDAALSDRTSGNTLIAPWPADGGAPEKQFSAYNKFLPVELDPAPSDPRSEVSL